MTYFLVKEPSEEEKGSKENGDWGALIFGNVIREYGIEISEAELELLKFDEKWLIAQFKGQKFNVNSKRKIILKKLNEVSE